MRLIIQILNCPFETPNKADGDPMVATSTARTDGALSASDVVDTGSRVARNMGGGDRKATHPPVWFWKSLPITISRDKELASLSKKLV